MPFVGEYDMMSPTWAVDYKLDMAQDTDPEPVRWKKLSTAELEGI